MTSSLYLGIDTGGTFTDGVLLDPQQHQIIRTAKVLTTHHDLSICINQVLEHLIGEQDKFLINTIRLVSLSTTLATNAIVEGKSRPVALFLLGYDAGLVYKFNFHQQFGTPHFYFFPGGMDMQGQEQAPLDEAGLAGKIRELQGRVEAYAVSAYAGTLNGSHEERAGEIIARLSGLPVVQGHHLTSRLNSIRRATTATLNAGLLSTTYAFMNTVRAMLVRRGIHCPLAVVRGDGSLVSADFAAHRPVEIIHSGPATSAIGGLYLAKTDSALVIDIGGTTTDLSILQSGRVILDGGEATVGCFPTSVRTIRSRSFGLGGDSQIRFDPHGQVAVGPERVIPISYLAHAYPEIRKDLFAWLSAAPEKFYSDRLEYWLLRREPLQMFADPRTRRVLELLRGGDGRPSDDAAGCGGDGKPSDDAAGRGGDGRPSTERSSAGAAGRGSPRRVAWLLKQAGAVSPVQVDAGQLIREDIISRAGLTPTDLLHVTGEYAPWDAEAARRVVEAAARMLGLSPEDFIRDVRQRMTRIIVAEILHFLTGQPVPDEMNGNNGSLARWMFEQNMAGADPFLACQIKLKLPLVGIGAPARAFLTPVGEALGTPVLFPEHYEVANAVGTVVGNVLVQKEAEVLPQVDGTVVTGYLARVNGTQQLFVSAEEALAFAREKLAEKARAEAIAAGADTPGVELSEQERLGGMYTITARAMGKPGTVIHSGST